MPDHAGRRDCARTGSAEAWGRKIPQVVVIDEVAGQLTAFLFLPVDLFHLAGGTVLFRLFDIWKPYRFAGWSI